MKHLSILIIMFGLFSSVVAQQNFCDFTVKDTYGNDFDLKQLKGKKVMVVNTASKCGLTPQYKKLQELYTKYKDDGFVIIAFPANNFGRQEPGTNKEIQEFCSSKYGIDFPIMSKISVKGSDIHPLYQWLTRKSENGILDAPVRWNFQKFLIDESGQIVKSIPPQIAPDAKQITNWIKGD